MSMAVSARMAARDWGLLVLLSVLWGGGFVLSKIALTELPPLTVALARLGIAAAAMVLLARASGAHLPRDGRVWASFFAMGILNNALPFGLLAWAQTQISSGLAAILNAATPLFTVLLAHLLTRDERLTAARVMGVLIGIGGVAILVGMSVAVSTDTKGVAEVACLLAALSYAMAAIFGRRLRRSEPLISATAQVSCAVIALLPAALWIDRPWTLLAPGPTTWASLAVLALPGTALAYVVYFRLLASAGASNLSLVTLLIPVSALAIAAIVLGEPITRSQVVGLGLIAAGLGAIDGRPWHYLKSVWAAARVKRSVPRRP